MTKYILLVLFVVLTACQPKQKFWDQESNTFFISNSKGKTLLANCNVAIEFTNGTVVSSKDERFLVEVNFQNEIGTIQFKDKYAEFDFNLKIELLDELSARLELDFVNQSSNSVFIEKMVSLNGNIAKTDFDSDSKVLINSTDWQDENIVLALNDSLKSIKSMYTIAVNLPSVAAGFLEGKKHFNYFNVNDEPQRLNIEAWGEGNGCELPGGKSRSADPLFISLNENSLKELERFADLASQQNDAKVWPENRAVWCTWYAGWNREKMYSYKNGIAKGIEEQLPYVKNELLTRGARTMRVCDDHIAYGDWYDKTKAFPEGLSNTARFISEAGLIPGVWYPTYWASTGSDIYKQHPEWFALENDGSTYLLKSEFQNRSRLKKPYKFLIFDTSVPEVQDYFEKTARTWKERGFKYVTNDFLAFATAPPKYHNPTFSKAEVLRAGLEAVKRGLDEDVFYRTIGAQFGTAMGLSNDMRISGDSHGDKPFAYHRTAAVWFYNHKLWINDPSAIVFMRYGEFRDLDWNKMWVSWIALAGTVMTYGEQLNDLPEEYLNVYKKVFPPLNIAGRPLDIWENQPYTMWGMQPEKKDSSYCLFGIFNLDAKAKQNSEINLDEILSRSLGWKNMETASEKYLLWDFWNEKLLESEGAKIDIKIPEKSCRVFALRKYEGAPQLLGTNGHFSMGAVETENISWDAEKGVLSGNVKGNGGDATNLFFYVPENFEVRNATLNAQEIKSTRNQNVLKINVPATAKIIPFLIQFEGKQEPVLTRKFIKGRAATQY